MKGCTGASCRTLFSVFPKVTSDASTHRALKSDDKKKKRAWLSSDGKEWETCEMMQPLKQRCLLPNWQTHNFGCDVELLAAEWNRSRTPAILDYVQGILGPDFFQWGCHFFKKDPQDGSVIPWQ